MINFSIIIPTRDRVLTMKYIKKNYKLQIKKTVKRFISFLTPKQLLKKYLVIKGRRNVNLL